MSELHSKSFVSNFWGAVHYQQSGDADAYHVFSGLARGYPDEVGRPRQGVAASLISNH